MLKEQFSLKNKKGIITGASRGLGRGMAEGLAEMGADLVIAARDMEKLKKAAGELQIHGGKIVPVKTDVGNDDDLKKLVETTCTELGDIDFVFCNAGIIRRGISHEHSVDDFDDVYRVNVHSVFVLAQFATQHIS